jgi:PilZ domain
MTEAPERRAVPRLALSGNTIVRTQVGVAVRLLDLSLRGVRIAHRSLLRAGSLCALDLPAALGGRVRGQVVWCAVQRAEPRADGERVLRTHSGVQFEPLTAAQQAVLGRALRDLTAWTAASYTPPHEHDGGAMTEPRDRRALPRTTLAERRDARVPGLREVRLRDLSLTGAQIEHLHLVRLGASCTLELPPPFGALSLPAEVVWCTVIGRKRTLGDASYLVARSGLWFTRLTGPQHGALVATLQYLAARPSIVDSQRRSA